MPADSQTLNVQLTWNDVTTGQGVEFVGPLPITFGRTDENAIILSSNRISRHHATLRTEGGRIILTDNQSTNGTFVNGERIKEVQLTSGSSFQMGPFNITVKEVPAAAVQAAQLPATRKALEKSALFSQSFLGKFAGVPVGESALLFSHEDKLLPEGTQDPVEETLPLGGMRQPIIPINEIHRSGLPIIETTYLAVGGGIGSFTWVDHLRIFGAPADQIAALGLEPRPMGRYSRLCGNSQIPLHERLRSNSESCPDNVWGWPSYGLREIFGSIGEGNIGNAWWVAKHVFGEPVLDYTYTPRSGDVFRSVDKEAQRIGWGRIWRYGRVLAVRKTDDGRYVVAYEQVNAQGQKVQCLAIARFVHLAMGYPGIRILDDIQEYRERTRDYTHTVNAYEEHNHVYEDLLKNGGVVMIRGRGIVASRVIQRLYEVRQKNKNITIIHLHRNPVPQGHLDGRARRPVLNHVELQPFNWPKGCWTGSMRIRLERADDEKRVQLLNDWGGTTTADRTDWQKIANRGLREGWYQIYFGEVKRLERNNKGKVVTQVSTGKPNQPEIALIADYIIDCTGLEAAIDKNPVLNDMVNCYHLRLNPKGRLYVSNDFEVEGMSNGPGRVYASGVMTLGGPHAVVDSFLGLQYAALRSVEDLARLRAPGLKKLTPLRSFGQWMRWMRGADPNRRSSSTAGPAYAGGIQGQGVRA
jgi:pSer/pThr/pTyr-binding forkhead associated (FHA) protein